MQCTYTKLETIGTVSNARWILLGIKTIGIGPSHGVVELAAQRMLGWEVDGPSFRKWLKPDETVPPGISHAPYTRKFLERNGEASLSAYREFADYVKERPLVSFNLDFTLESVLKPEWDRLHVPPIGRPGFCAMRLAQRLLDPLPAGLYKLQTLRQFYALSERVADSAMDDVQVVAQLMAKVLRPIVEHRALDTWEALVNYAGEEWHPSRIPFGKHKGRLFLEARQDEEMRRWIKRLQKSPNAKFASMGRWYLGQLDRASEQLLFTFMGADPDAANPDESALSVSAAGSDGLILYVNPELEQMRLLVSELSARLASLEVAYTKEKINVQAIQAEFFRRLRKHYQRRDMLRILLDYRMKHLASLREGNAEEDLQQTQDEFERATTENNQKYEETATSSNDRMPLTAEEEDELNALWRKLVKLYHPDRFAHEPDKLETYEKLTAAINRAKGNGDIAALKAIADDPMGYILRQGWTLLDFSEEVELKQLKQLYETLQMEVLNMLESLEQLKATSDYKLYQLSGQEPGILDDLVAKRAVQLEKDNVEMEEKAAQIALEIEELASLAEATTQSS